MSDLAAAKAADELSARILSAVAWLRAVANGSTDVAEPPAGDLNLIADVIETAEPGYVQRDKSFIVPDQVTQELKRPLKISGKPDEAPLAVLTFRPPTAKEIKQIALRAKSHGEEDAAIFMLSTLSDDKLLVVDVERMLEIDVELCAEKLEPFLGLKRLSAAPRR